MKKFVLLSLFLFSAIIFSGCFSLAPQIRTVFPRNSFLFVEKKSTFFQCKTNKCSIVHQGRMTGSASVIYHSNKSSYILTAAHMIWMEPISNFKRIMLESQGKLKIVSTYTFQDITGRKYKLKKIIKSDKKSDLAIVSIDKVNIPMLHISSTEPKLGEKLYNVAAPTGLFGKDLVGMYEGRYLGIMVDRSFGGLPMAITGIPVAGGSSGSPILNSDGYIVGMVSAVSRRFHHISISPTWKQLNDFVNKHLKKFGFGFCINPDPHKDNSEYYIPQRD